MFRQSPNIVQFSRHSVRIAHHGGLTPAALGNVRLYSANIVFHSERTSCNQERLA
jgi:hypothetical protein